MYIRHLNFIHLDKRVTAISSNRGSVKFNGCRLLQGITLVLVKHRTGLILNITVLLKSNYVDMGYYAHWKEII